jgi:RimJ/RimL family protein N-acetyltransferase
MQVLVTRRLTLRPPAMLDAEDIALWLSNWNVTRMLSVVPYPYARQDAEAWIESHASKPRDLHYTIHRERLIGCVSIGIDDDKADLGYWLAEPWHGRGFMTEAARALIAYAFETQGITAITSCVFADNPRSLRTQEKLGFSVTGAAELFSVSRNEMVPTITTRLTAEAFASTHLVRSAA